MDYVSTFKNKTILITGGTGSVGTALTSELLKLAPREVRIFSRDEEKQLDMQSKFPSSKLKFIVGDVRDEEAIGGAAKGVNYLYHAAALKIIPVCEEFPMESVKTNLLGSWNVKKVAMKNLVEKSIFISTDKAVQPINIYGACKMIAERIWTQNQTECSKFSAVRYGNVIGSRGSVVPLFKTLIQKKRPVPITHPQMTRFLLTLNRAVETIFHATEYMMGGEVFVPKLPSCNIVDLPKVLARSKHVLLKNIGVRAGEKLHEILICSDEFRHVKDLEGYYIVRRHDKYNSEITTEYNSATATRLDVQELKALLEESGWL